MDSIDEMKNQDDLRRILKGQAGEIDELRRKAWAAQYTQAATSFPMEGAEKFKTFLRGAVSKNMGLIEESGGKAVSPMSELVTKGAPLGTPLFSDSASGAYLAPTEFHKAVVYVMNAEAVISPECQHVIMGSRLKTIPVESTALVATWLTSQATGFTESNPTFTQYTLTAIGLNCYIPMTEDFLDDDAASVFGYFASRAGQQFASKIDNAILQGFSGVASGLMNTSGILSGAASVTMAAGKTTHSAVSYDDLVSVVTALPTAALRKGARWYMSPTIKDALRLKKDGNGRPLILDPVQAGPTFMLGYEIRESDEAPASAAAGKPFIAFGNPQSIIIGDRKQLEVRLYDQTFYRATSNEVFLTAYLRIAFAYPTPTSWAVLKTAGA